MADKISNKDIFEGNLYQPTKKESEDFLKVLVGIKDEIIAISKESKKELQLIDPSTAAGIKKLEKAQRESLKLKKASVVVSKEEIKVNKRLKVLTTEEVKLKLRFQKATKGQRDAIKDLLVLQNKESGTLEKLAASSRVLRREREKLNLSTAKGRGRLVEINTLLNKNNEALIKNSDNLKKNKLNVGNYAQSIIEAEKKLRSQKTALTENIRALKIAAQQTARNTSEQNKIQKELQQTQIKYRQVTGALKKFEAANKKGFNSVNKSIGGLKRMALALGAGFLGIQVLTRGIRNSTSIITSFEKSNSELRAVLNGTTFEMDALSRSAKNLGATTAFTASEVNGLNLSLAKLGFPTEDILKMNTAILAGASAMGSDLGATATLVGATLKSFGLDASETGRVVDVLAKSTSETALDFAKLDASMSTIAPVAKKFGFSIEATVSLLGELANAGFDASSAATATRNILLNLADANGKLAKSLKEPVKDLPSLVKGLKQLKDEGTDLGKALELTDKRSVAAFATFLDGTDDVLALNASLEKAGGTAQRMADVQLDNLEGKLKILNSAFEGFILSLDSGDGFVSRMAKSVVELSTAFFNLITETEKESDAIIKQQRELNGLVNRITDVNIKEEDRAVLIKELNKIYPDLLKNIDAETVSNEELVKQLKEVNKQFVNRIVLARQQEKLAEQAEEQADAQEKLIKATILLNKIIFDGTSLLDKNGKQVDLLNLSNRERVKLLREELLAFEKSNLNQLTGIKTGGRVFEVRRKLINALLALEVAQKDVNSEDKLAAEIQKELLELQGLLGVGDKESKDEKEDKNEVERRGLLIDIDKLISLKQEAILTAKTVDEIRNLTDELKTLQRQRKLIAGDRSAFQFLELIKPDLGDEDAERIKAESELADATFKIQVDGILKTEKEEKESNKRRKKSLKESLLDAFNLVQDFLKKESEARLRAINDQFEKTKSNSERLQRLADEGQLDAKQSLITEIQNEAKLRQAREQEIQNQKNLELGLTALKAFTANVDSGDTNALGSTIAQITALLGFISSIGSFKDGTVDTGTVSRPMDKDGGRLAIIHNNERYMPKVDNVKTGGMPNSKLADLAYSYNHGMLGEMTRYDLPESKPNEYQSNAEILKAFESLEKTVKANKPIDQSGVWDERKKEFRYLSGKDREKEDRRAAFNKRAPYV